MLLDSLCYFLPLDSYYTYTDMFDHLLQAIFSFNGANISGFDSFRKDFPSHKEVCLVIGSSSHESATAHKFLNNYYDLQLLLITEQSLCKCTACKTGKAKEKL